MGSYNLEFFYILLFRGAPAGPAQSYGRYTPGYGGAAAATSVFRAAPAYGVPGPPAGGSYGYPAGPAGMAPQGYYGGATMAPAPGGYAGYGGAPQGGAPAGGAGGYGGAAQYSPAAGRPGFPADGGADFNGQPVDGRAGQPKGKQRC